MLRYSYFGIEYSGLYGNTLISKFNGKRECKFAEHWRYFSRVFLDNFQNRDIVKRRTRINYLKMKTKNNQQSIAFLSILAGVMYFLFLIVAFIGAHQEGKENMSSYWEKRLSLPEKNSANDDANYKKVAMISNQSNLFADSVFNKKTQSYIPLNVPNVDVIIDKEEPNTFLTISALLIFSFLMILALPAMIYVPILFYKLMHSIYKGNIFTRENVRRINLLGYIFIALLFLFLTSFYVDYFNYTSMVQLDGYHVAPPNIMNAAFPLLFGVIILLVGRVMKKALIMQEEQELTI